ncbi:LPS export ABC transporter ATP-binding protein [PVC group bacterium (ex Bugula neritina AB1)]|nr:LPS export ABC transporter ATP-binding protein [PVC group bacterium (ex Bugula neritina AB1)]
MLVLETKNIVKYYKHRPVVNNVNISVEKGEIVGLLGPNGAGKTTTFQTIVGLVRPDEGQIFYEKKDITKLPMYKRARIGMSYLPQEPSVFQKMTVENNIMAALEMMPLSPFQRKYRLEKLMQDLKISYLSQSRAFSLSGGERRRLEIARALARNPSFILLDEPFSGVDPISVAEVQQIIYSLKKTGLSILLTDHNVRETLSITDRSYIMYKGEVLASGTSEKLLEDAYAKRLYFGESFTL